MLTHSLTASNQQQMLHSQEVNMSFDQQAGAPDQVDPVLRGQRRYQKIAACFQGQQEGMPLTSAPPGSLMVSWGERNTCSGCSHSGSMLPGAIPQMKVCFRD